MEDWNEPRLVLAVQRAASQNGVAKSVRLFETFPAERIRQHRPANGWPAGAERMEDEAFALGRDVAGRDHRLSGRLRVTSSETLAYRMLTPPSGGIPGRKETFGVASSPTSPGPSTAPKSILMQVEERCPYRKSLVAML